MLKNARELTAGAGIGLLGGLVIGITDYDWIRLAIALTLIAYSGGLKKQLVNVETNHLNRTLTGFTAFLAVLAGLYLNKQQVFEQSPREAVNALTEAGYSPSEAREFYLKQVLLEKARLDSASPSLQSIVNAFAEPDIYDTILKVSDTITGP
ncbi:MAG: hypothetical protein FD166_1114 [Bacteroidetes bacterium]|nr:MAG: hypothetical protein FD166_1114 [Bacteroidota bacterium]